MGFSPPLFRLGLALFFLHAMGFLLLGRLFCAFLLFFQRQDSCRVFALLHHGLYLSQRADPDLVVGWPRNKLEVAQACQPSLLFLVEGGHGFGLALCCASLWLWLRFGSTAVGHVDMGVEVFLRAGHLIQRGRRFGSWWRREFANVLRVGKQLVGADMTGRRARGGDG